MRCPANPVWDLRSAAYRERLRREAETAFLHEQDLESQTKDAQSDSIVFCFCWWGLIRWDLTHRFSECFRDDWRDYGDFVEYFHGRPMKSGAPRPVFPTDAESDAESVIRDRLRASVQIQLAACSLVLQEMEASDGQTPDAAESIGGVTRPENPSAPSANPSADTNSGKNSPFPSTPGFREFYNRAEKAKRVQEAKARVEEGEASAEEANAPVVESTNLSQIAREITAEHGGKPNSLTAIYRRYKRQCREAEQ